MLKRPRVIPTLLIEDDNLVKTKKFSKSRYLGDPLNAIRIFNEKSVDELCVLDICASKERRGPQYELLEKMAAEAFMPLSYGGGIADVDQIKRVFRIGFEKVIINTAASRDIDLIRKASESFGSQSIVAAIDYKSGILGRHCYIYDGTKRIKYSPEEYAAELTKAGVGEILLYSIDRDGMMCGFDIECIRRISSEVMVPVIACGGAESLSDIKEALLAGASAVAAGSMFVYFGDRQAVLINYPSEKEFIEHGIYE